MFDLDAAVGEWRAGMRRGRVLTSEDLDELEDHLRAAYEVELHLEPSLLPSRAFARAQVTLGLPNELAGEFAKVAGRGWRRLLTAAWVTFGASWLLPVHRHGISLTDVDWGEGLLPGIQALWLALSDPGEPMAMLSGLTNLFMLATVMKIAEAGRSRVAGLAFLLLAGVVVNGWWLLAMEPHSDLLAGYWAWMSSFAMAGGALALRARVLPEETPGALAAAP